MTPTDTVAFPVQLATPILTMIKSSKRVILFSTIDLDLHLHLPDKRLRHRFLKAHLRQSMLHPLLCLRNIKHHWDPRRPQRSPVIMFHDSRLTFLASP